MGNGDAFKGIGKSMREREREKKKEKEKESIRHT